MNKKQALLSLLTIAISCDVALAQTSVTDTYKSSGITACAGKAEEISSFIVGKNNESSHLYWNTNSPNKRHTSALIMNEYSDATAFTTLVVNPEGGACDWTYTETSYSPKGCVAIREEWIPDAKYETTMGRTAIYKGSSANYYLADAGSGCLFSRREAHYD